MRHHRYDAVLTLLALLAFLAAPRAEAAPDVLLNEILAGPARDWDNSGAFSSRDDEWVEILNAGDQAADLAGFFLTDADSVPRYAFTGPLGVGATSLVTGAASTAWEKANGRPAVGLSLANTGDAVLLWRAAGPDTLLVDAYAFKSHEAGADRSSGRDPQTRQWQLFDGLDPYTGTALPAGNHCVPTPGASNECRTTPGRRSTWGRVKQLYR